MTVLRQAKHSVSLVLALLFLGLAAIVPALAQPVSVHTEALLLNPEQPAERQAGQLEYLGGLVLSADRSLFGGYSGIVVDPDGAGLWAISDVGHWLRLDFTRDGAGLPSGIGVAQILPLRDANGAPVTRKVLSDAEGLRRMTDGRWLVSFERAHRIWTFDRPGGAATGTLDVPTSVADQPDNGGIEALAGFSNGDLILFSEDKPALVSGDRQNTAVWLWRGGRWHDLAWAARDDFKPTDAVALPDGDLLLLQRYFTPLIGPKARIARIPAAEIQPGALLQGELLAELSRPQSVDNMEALDVRLAGDGSLWLYVMSDDNQNPMQRTLLMVFRYQP